MQIIFWVTGERFKSEKRQTFNNETKIDKLEAHSHSGNDEFVIEGTEIKVVFCVKI